MDLNSHRALERVKLTVRVNVFVASVPRITGMESRREAIKPKSFCLEDVVASLFLVNVSPARRKIAAVPIPNASWKMAAKGAFRLKYSNESRMSMLLSDNTEATVSFKYIAKNAEITRPIAKPVSSHMFCHPSFLFLGMNSSGFTNIPSLSVVANSKFVDIFIASLGQLSTH